MNIAEFAKLPIICLMIFVYGCSQPAEPVDHKGAAGMPSDPGSTLLARVEISGEVTSFPAAAKVFVFIREKGKTMPLAVEQFAPQDLPVQVGFSKPEASISTIEAIARLSMTGAVMKHPNDPEVISEPLDTEDYARSIRLVIPQNTLADAGPNSAAVRVAVTIPPQVQISPTARLFVIAKMEDGLNPMPVAVKAYNINEIPEEIVLTDRDSMMSVARLSRNKAVQVTVRLSQSGTTKKQAGDWESKPQLIATKDAGLNRFELTEEVE
jgi:hypothetical protein